MTGHIAGGVLAHEKEKIHALMRINGDIKVFDLTKLCWESGDKILTTIKSSTIRRCLQELEAENNARQIDSFQKIWRAFPLESAPC